MIAFQTNIHFSGALTVTVFFQGVYIYIYIYISPNLPVWAVTRKGDEIAILESKIRW